LHRKIGWLFALEDAIDITRRAPELVHVFLVGLTVARSGQPRSWASRASRPASLCPTPKSQRNPLALLFNGAA
jgi:hypothetical protein